MDNNQNLQELENRKVQLQERSQLSKRFASGQLPDPLLHADLKDVIQLLEKAASDHLLQTDPEIQEFFTDFIDRSTEGVTTTLEAETDLISMALETGKDQQEDIGFGMHQAAIPIRFQNQTIHVLLSGRFRTQRISADDLHRLARLTGKPAIEVQNAANALPILSEAQVQVLLNLYRLFRDAVETAIEHTLTTASARHQLLQSERTRSLGSLSGGLAHQFNNLLSVVLGYSSFILSKGSHAPEVADALRKIGEAAQKGRRLTQEILAFSGNEQEGPKASNLHDTLSSVLSLIESELGSQTRIERDLSAADASVVAPPSALRQLVFNLLNNAAQGLPKGGLLRVATSNTMLGDKKAGQQNFLKIEVTDSGSAVTRSAESEENVKLSNIYGIAGRMDGTVTVRPLKDGTRVEVLIPCSGAGASAPAESGVRASIGPSVIWVIDDDPIFLEMCNQLLGDEGHTVSALESGDALKARWKSGSTKPDLVITDFIMPECNGRELVEWLQEQKSTIPVILVSGFSDEQPDIRAALTVPRTHFLQKPFTTRDLVDAVTMALGQKLIA